MKKEDNRKNLNYPLECNYKELPLDENDDYDIDNFTRRQLEDFYWDNPEAIPDD